MNEQTEAMSTMTNTAWIERLSGDNREEAIKDLHAILRRALVRFAVSTEDKEDFVQSAIVSILGKLSTFRGRSKFTTWAIAIVVNTALSEIRKKRWSNVSLEDLCGGADLAEPAAKTPDVIYQRRWALELIDSLIQSELSLKQRTALLAELNGMPLPEIAVRMNTTRGAIYKLTYDARKKLIQCLENRDLSLAEIVSAME